MTYLEMAKQAQARLRAARDTNSGSAVDAESPMLPICQEVVPAVPWDHPAEAPATPVRDLIAAYRGTLDQLWTLGAQGANADPVEICRALAEQARQCDNLSPVFAAAVSRQASRDWAERERRCPYCGLEDTYHDPVSGEPVALAPRSDAMPAPLDASGWPVALPRLGARRPGPFAPCSQCGAGTFATFGAEALCQRCALARGGHAR